MFLDQFKLSRLIVLVEYAPAIELWDNAGSLNRKLQKIWPGLEVVLDQANPANVVQANKTLQSITGLTRSVLTFNKIESLEAVSPQIVESFVAWRSDLGLTTLSRVSTRALYSREFPAPEDVNKELFSLGICAWPTEMVFDQPTTSPKNTFTLRYRFEDEKSFAFLALRAESVLAKIEANEEFGDTEERSISKNRLILDFDRGLVSPVAASEFRMADWLKGFTHILNRDIEKIVPARRGR